MISKTNILFYSSIHWICKWIHRIIVPIGIDCSTFVCPTEIIAFSDRIKEFQSINTEGTWQYFPSSKQLLRICLVVAISVDSQFTHLGKISNQSFCHSFILSHSMDQYSTWTRWSRQNSDSSSLRSHTSNFQRLRCFLTRCWPCIEVELGFNAKLSTVIFRGLFIIDGRGILRQITMNDLPVGRSTDETLRLLQAFQYTDKHGEGKSKEKDSLHWSISFAVCPAGWRPGSDTIIPNPEEKLKYFSKNYETKKN